MPDSESKYLRSSDRVLIGQPWYHRSLIAIVLLALMVAPLGGQTPGTTDRQGPERDVVPLPATTGEPLTIVPLDSPDIECSIQEWSSARPLPFLKLLCPPQAVYAQVRVYLRLSWLKPQDVSKDVDKIITRTRQSTMIRASGTGVKVRMEISGEKGHPPQARWVDFNGVADIALITDSHRR